MESPSPNAQGAEKTESCPGNQGPLDPWSRNLTWRDLWWVLLIWGAPTSSRALASALDFLPYASRIVALMIGSILLSWFWFATVLPFTERERRPPVREAARALPVVTALCGVPLAMLNVREALDWSLVVCVLAIAAWLALLVGGSWLHERVRQ